ncbi:MAG: hypothetical protein MI864_12145, partial [Pseudomonadales bacterium]|nr:hypothetical protein [Pseudomonadales bacterium]
MFKAFGRLWLFIILPLVVLLYPSDYNPINSLSNWLFQDRVVNTYQGTFYLLEKRLNQHPQSEWEEQFPDITRNFVYDI